MRRRLAWTIGGSAALLMVAVGVATNQIYSNGKWSWLWFVGAIITAVLSVATGQWLNKPEPRGILRLTDGKGRPLRFRELAPAQLGVHPNQYSRDGRSLYVRRDQDHTLGQALLGDQRVIIVQGKRLAGTTSTLVQAAQDHLSDVRVMAFTQDRILNLAEMVGNAHKWATDPSGAVLWLDPLTLDNLGQFDEAFFQAIPDSLKILATLHTDDISGFRVPPHVMRSLDQHAALIRLGTISDKERAELLGEPFYAELKPALKDTSEVLMGRLMVAMEQIEEALTVDTGAKSADRVALLRAVTDWHRVYMPLPLTGDELAQIYKDYRREIADLDTDAPISKLRFQRAQKWALREESSKRPQLVDRVVIDKHEFEFTPHPLLAVAADDSGGVSAWDVAATIWRYADRTLKGDQRRDIGYTALSRRAYPYACALLDHDDTRIEPEALQQVASWLHETGEIDAARSWYTKIIDTCEPDAVPHAMINLGKLEAEQGNMEMARQYLQQAIDSRHPDAAPTAMGDLGSLEYDQGNRERARRLWMQVIATRHENAAPRAMVNVGRLEAEQGRRDQARRLWKKAIDTHHPDAAPEAMLGLGQLEHERGNVGLALRWWDQTIATGHPEAVPRAMISAGMLHMEQGKYEETRRYWKQAILTGHTHEAPKAMANLGRLEAELGNAAQARQYFEQVAAADHPDVTPGAIVNFGRFEYDQGNYPVARKLWMQAIATDHPRAAPEAMVNLGSLEASLGNFSRARQLWQQAIGTGHPEAAPGAMMNLARLEADRGSRDLARQYLQQAIATRNREVSAEAKRRLREFDRLQAEDTRAEHAGQYGWQLFADPKLMKPDNPEDSGNRKR